jgi:integrase
MSIRNRTWTSPAGETKSAWEVSYRAANGKRVRKLFDRKKDADDYHAKARIAVQNGTHTADSQSITVAVAATQWLARCDERGLERSSVVSYGERVRLHILPFIGGVKLSQLTAPAVALWEDKLRAEGRTAHGIRKARMALGAILKHAQLRGLVAQNVVAATGREEQAKRAEGTRKLKVGVDIPAVAEVKAILPHAQGRFRALFLVAAFCGLRASELRGLTWANVDLKAGELHVSQRMDRYGTIGAPKSEAGDRTVPVLPMVVQALREHKLANPTNEQGLVFVNSRGHAIHRQVMVAELAAAQVAADVVDVTGAAKYTGMHALRHFFASWCINRKVDGGLELPLKVVQGRIGHSSIEMTANVYSHLFPATDTGAEMAAAEASFLAG